MPPIYEQQRLTPTGWTHLLLFGLAAILILFTVLWVVSLRLENSSVAEVAWGPAILMIGLTYYFTSDGGSIRAHVTLALLALWAARLSVHLGMRIRLQGEDFRYVKWRDVYDPWWLVSYFKVFLFQAVAAWLVSLPIYFAVVSIAPASLTLTDYIGILLVVCGLAIEALGDEQLRRFRANRANRVKVLDTGLWQYTRHPNYFGEVVLWWGFGLISLATGGVPGLFGPAILTYLLIYISGIRLLEATLIEKPGYIHYVGRTPSLVPLPPKVRIQIMAKLRELQKKPEPVRPKRRY
jgi:steroid 5-alpha reductase family enzyme